MNLLSGTGVCDGAVKRTMEQVLGRGVVLPGPVDQATHMHLVCHGRRTGHRASLPKGLRYRLFNGTGHVPRAT